MLVLLNLDKDWKRFVELFKRRQLLLSSFCQQRINQITWKIREIDWLYLCLQRFDEFWIWSARYDRKRKLCESAETSLEKFVKSLQENLFLAGFSHMKPLCCNPRDRNKTSIITTTYCYRQFCSASTKIIKQKLLRKLSTCNERTYMQINKCLYSINEYNSII